jgi:hypothetical protein
MININGPRMTVVKIAATPMMIAIAVLRKNSVHLLILYILEGFASKDTQHPPEMGKVWEIPAGLKPLCRINGMIIGQ